MACVTDIENSSLADTNKISVDSMTDNVLASAYCTKYTALQTVFDYNKINEDNIFLF